MVYYLVRYAEQKNSQRNIAGINIAGCNTVVNDTNKTKNVVHMLVLHNKTATSVSQKKMEARSKLV